ncbi:tumor necrosis factor ligand superfamily member 13B-like isoform X2 [Mastacembelus armatus]|uniref:tumor necrosis factor ligand superfamily member 13B-like isoform X2 n=1 Tax=Mastacembelus armatus TaxID=205130 RepID=UPI000E45DC37|nr:tumor necrosis factor ligand superfamily member 13B-like isoform X2 [Mastacembelus armatus]
MCDLTHLSNLRTFSLSSLSMLYSVLSLTAFMFCLSLFLVHRASVLENDFRQLKGDIILQLNQPRSEGVNGKMAKMSKTREDIKQSTFQKAQSSLKMSSRKVKREQGSCRAPASFLQLTANTNKQPDIRGDITVIPWTVSAQQGNAISQKENRIVVQEDGYYLVFGQVLFKNSSMVMGHVIRSWGSTKAGTSSTELLRCLQEMSGATPASTCYTAGTLQLHQGDELELVIPYRPQARISMDEDSTFFGVIQLN